MKRPALLTVLVALVATGCAGAKMRINPDTQFPLPADANQPAFLFPINLGHLGSGADPLAMGLVVSAGITSKFGKAVVSGQQLFDFAGNLSFELAESIQTQAHSGKWVMDGSAVKTADDLAAMMEQLVQKLVELKVLERPLKLRYVIAVHSHGSSTMGGSVLAVESWGGIYDLETKTISSYIETKDNLANKPDAVIAALPATYNGIISKLLAGTVDAPQE
jgi:hypothetical protein